MKKTIGKIGLGLAGAVAAVGFLAMSPAPVSAQIVLSGSSPVVSGTSPNYLYDYTVDLADGATLSNFSTTQSIFSISWLASSDVTGVTYTGDLNNSALGTPRRRLPPRGQDQFFQKCFSFVVFLS